MSSISNRLKNWFFSLRNPQRLEAKDSNKHVVYTDDSKAAEQSFSLQPPTSTGKKKSVSKAHLSDFTIF